MKDPSAVHAMEMYGNYHTCVGPLGDSGIVLLPDGKYYDSWYVYYRDTLDADEFASWCEWRRKTKQSDFILGL